MAGGKPIKPRIEAPIRGTATFKPGFDLNVAKNLVESFQAAKNGEHEYFETSAEPPPVTAPVPVVTNPTARQSFGETVESWPTPVFNGREIPIPISRAEKQAFLDERNQSTFSALAKDTFRLWTKPYDFGSTGSTQAAADAAMTAPLVTKGDGAAYTYDGPWATVTGLHGVKLSAPVAFYTARHLGPEGKLLIMHTNDGNPNLNAWREATHVDGIPVPPSLRGKILEVGDPVPDSTSFPQVAQMIVNYLEAARGSDLFAAFDLVNGRQLRMTGFSNGGLAAVLVRMVLEAQGLDGIFERIDTLGTPHHGSQGMQTWLAEAYLSMAYAWGMENGFATGELTPDVIASRLHGASERLVDLAIAAELDLFTLPGFGRANMGEWSGAWTWAWSGNPRPGDGLVASADALYGKNHHRFSQPAGHRSLFTEILVWREYLEIQAGVRTPSVKVEPGP